MYAAPGGGVTRRAADALAALHEAGISIVPISGRTAPQMLETARVIGARDFIAELGGITVYGLGEEVVRSFGRFAGEGTAHEAMERSGVAALLMESFPGLLEPHAPWSFMPRECSMLLRGNVSLEEARGVLEEAGYDWLDLRDNGVIPRAYPTLQVEEVHAYHLLPRGITKTAAASADLQRRKLARAQTIAVGDSPADAELAAAVGAVFIVANGRRAVEDAAEAPPNLYATERAQGEGFAEVVEELLLRADA